MLSRASAVGDLHFRDVLKIPNLITLGRLALVPVIFFCLREEGQAYLGAAVALILLAVAADSLDGYLAHRLNQTTALGRILDPLADKISVGCGILFLLFLRDFPLWAAAIIVGRDVAILSLSLVLMRREDSILPSSLLGKATVLSLGGMILFHVVEMQPLATTLTYVAVALVVVSGLGYILSFWRAVRHRREVPAE